MPSINSIMQIATSGLKAHQFKIDAIANNLANVDTPGFKETRVGTHDAEYKAVNPLLQPGKDAGYDQVGTGVRVAMAQKVFTQGAFRQTGYPLDLAIMGDGFFRVQTPDGATAYTREGQFNVDGDRQLVTSQGLYVQPGITIPPDAREIIVDESGNVSVTISETAGPQKVGALQLAQVPNPSGMSSLGSNLYQVTAASGEATVGQAGTGTFGRIASGGIEAANVDVGEAMTSLMGATRAYQLSLKMVQALDEILSMANSVRR